MWFCPEPPLQRKKARSATRREGFRWSERPLNLLEKRNQTGESSRNYRTVSDFLWIMNLPFCDGGDRPLNPIVCGITYDRLQGDGLSGLVRNQDHPGTKFLHQGRFTRGKGLFSAIEYKPPAEVADDEFPFQLTTGRIHVHYHTGTMTRNSPSWNERSTNVSRDKSRRCCRAWDCRCETVLVTSRRGSVSTRVKLAGRGERKTVFMPFHFVESRANILTNPIFDPVAKIPEF